jgi:P27 family predicted phage terminase small subunit
MPAGRKRTPLETREREGNAGKRHLPERLVLDDSAPLKPAVLGAAGAQLWDDVVGPLSSVRVVQKVDAAALTALCVQWDVAEAARLVLATEGHYATGSMGQLVEHPALAMMTRAHQMFLKLAAEFGLTAAARARIAESAAGAMASRAQAQLDDVIDLDAPEVVDVGG